MSHRRQVRLCSLPGFGEVGRLRVGGDPERRWGLMAVRPDGRTLAVRDGDAVVRLDAVSR